MKEERTPEKALSEPELRHFFLSHLNRIFYAKSALLDRLPQLEKRAQYLDLRQPINETVEVVELQIGRMRKMYYAG